MSFFGFSSFKSRTEYIFNSNLATHQLQIYLNAAVFIKNIKLAIWVVFLQFLYFVFITKL